MPIDQEIKHWMNLVKKIALSFYLKNLDHSIIYEKEDFVSWGLIGLWRGLETYRSELGVTKLNYLSRKIKWAIQDVLRCDRWFKCANWRCQKNALENKRYVDFLPVYFDYVYRSTDKEWEPLTVDGLDDFTYIWIMDKVKEVNSHLRPRQQYIINRILEGYKIIELAKIMHLSETRVIQLRNLAIDQIRQRMNGFKTVENS